MKPDDLYQSIQLSDEELKAAILEAKKKKWFKEKHAEYWINAGKAIKKAPVKQLMK